LDAAFDVDSFSGFLPCRFRGVESGFEYYSVLVDERERVEAGAPQGIDFAVTLVTHSDFREGASSLLAAGALCHASGGFLVDPQSGETWSSEEVLAWAKKQLSEFEPYLN
jgi:hypothetical protein